MIFKKDPISHPKTKRQRMSSGTDQIIEINGDFFLKSTGQKLKPASSLLVEKAMQEFKDLFKK